MLKLNASWTKILKILHIFCAVLWAGGATGILLLIQCVHPEGGQGMSVHAQSLKFLDDYMVIVGANGCLLTGLLYSIFTNFGFVKYRWVTIKWLLTIFMMSSGTFIMGPCVNGNAAMMAEFASLAGLLGADVVRVDADNLDTITRWGIVQIVLLAMTFILSVHKPWGRVASKRA